MRRKRYSKRVLSLILTVLMIVSIIPIGIVQASAYTAPSLVDDDIIQQRINDLRRLNETYFTVSHSDCGRGLNSHKTDYVLSCCSVRNIARHGGWLEGVMGLVPDSGDLFPTQYYTSSSYLYGPWDADSCAGFAKYAQWYIYAQRATDNLVGSLVASCDYNFYNMQRFAKPGDALRFGYSHSAIVVEVRPNGVLVLDSNYKDSTVGWKECMVHEHVIEYSCYRSVGITRCSNYSPTPIRPPKPSAPSKVTCSPKTLAASDTAKITWNAGSGATSYYVEIWTKNADGSNRHKFKDETVNGTSYSFVTDGNASDGQVYECLVYSKNSGGQSASASDSFTTKLPSTVTFMNWDGSVYEHQNVKYGYKAVAPSSNPPEREGYTFNGWDGIDNVVYEDTVINAKYTRNKYLVNFYKYVKNADGTRSAVKLGNTQKIYYGEDAVAPDVSTFDLPAGHVFAGWSDKFNIIKENKNIYLIDKWYNENMSVLVSNLVAERDDDGTGYTVTLRVTNNDTRITSGRVIVALKTNEEKLVETTESSAFSLKAGASKDLEIFIPSTKAASIVDAFAVEKFETAIPISVTQRANIQVDESNLWTDWSTEAPPADALNTQTKTQYRNRAKSIKTSGFDTLEGYTWYDQKVTTSTGTNFEQSVPMNSTTIEGKKTYTATTYYKYGLYGWTYTDSDWTYAYGKWESDAFSAGRQFYPSVDNYPDAVIRQGIRYFWNYETQDRGDSYKATKSAHYAHSSSNYTKELGTYTVLNSTFYKYGTFYLVTTTTTLNYFYKWLDWSDWSDISANAADIASGNTEQEERTVYRYVPKIALGVEDNTGVQRNIHGTLSADYAGQQATLFVYKYDEASDWTNEYVGQCIIAEDGSYNFDFILRDEPTVKTGDYRVTLGIEGTDMVLNLDPIKAPVEQFTVNYYNTDGTIITTQTVNKGDSAVIPDIIPAQEGYTFTGWSESNTAIKENLDIFPVMQINTYDVVFIDWEHQTYEMKQFNYGDAIEGPEIPNTEDKYFVGWDVVNNGTTLVTENLVACAEFETKTFDVKFYDWDGNEIYSENVEYGTSVAAPELDGREGYIFDGWDNYDYYFVTDYLEIHPVFHYENTVDDPSADIETGIYDETKTVTLACATEGASVYYTLDGSDPAENGTLYTKPIEIAKSTTLKFVAKKAEFNNSAVVTKCYAINKADMSSDWMTFDELPQEVVDNPSEFTMLSNIGYKFKDTMSTTSVSLKDQLLADGWTLESTDWTDPSEYSETYPEYPDNEIEITSRDGDFVEKFFYNYSHYKYVDANTGETVCKPTEVEGTNGEFETIKLENVLTVSKFVDGKAGYSYNGELWFNQEVTSEMVDPGFDVYSYRSKVFNFCKWTGWIVTPPSSSDTRERQTDTVFKYIVPKEYIVTLDYSKSDLAGKNNETMLVKEGKTLSLADNYFDAEGYSFDGLFTDEACTNAWNPDTDTVSENVTLYVKHTLQTFSVKFLNYDGAVISDQRVQYLHFAQIPENPQRDGYVFTGWEVTSGTESGNDGVSADVEYTAKYVAEEDYVRVSLSRSKLSLMTGSSAKIVVTLSSANASDSDVYIYSSNPEIATVAQDGTITAVHSGTTVITALSLDNYESANCVVTVLGSADTEILPISGSGLFVDPSSKYLLGVNKDNNTLGEIDELLENSGLIFTNSDGSVVYSEADNSKIIGTGYKIILKDNDMLIDDVEVVVYGDVNGDGAVDAFDLFSCNKMLNDLIELDGSYREAADMDGDGVVSLSDYSSMMSEL